MNEIRTYTFPGVVVRVEIPELSPEERENRMKSIHKAAVNLIVSSRKK